MVTLTSICRWCVSILILLLLLLLHRHLLIFIIKPIWFQFEWIIIITIKNSFCLKIFPENHSTNFPTKKSKVINNTVLRFKIQESAWLNNQQKSQSLKTTIKIYWFLFRKVIWLQSYCYYFLLFLSVSVSLCPPWSYCVYI